MRIPRIYHDGPLTETTAITLSPKAAQHVVQVLRLQPGMDLILFNGDGYDYDARLALAQRKSAVCVVEKRHPAHTESFFKIHLAQALARGERMDFALQKATELGVSAVTPLNTEYCNVHLRDEREEKRLQHWRNLMIAACEQCGRAVVPQLNAPQPLTAFAESQSGVRLALVPGQSNRLRELSVPSSGVVLCIGPEGGFSDSEIAFLQTCGFILTGLGPRILRTETAACAAMAAMQSLWGDL